jgi:hypothetical protein
MDYSPRPSRLLEHPARLQSTRGLVVWTSQGPVPGRELELTTAWALGTTRLGLHSARRRGEQGNQRVSTRFGS